METLEKFVEEFLAMGIEALHKYGSVNPVAFMINEKDLIIHPMDFSDKELAMQVLRKLCQENDVKKVITMGEAYLSHDLSGIPPSEAPDRRDVIVVRGEDINGKSCMTIQPFHRNKNGKIVLENTKKNLPVLPFGRMSGILTRRGHQV